MSSHRGFSLLEVMIFVAILATVLIAAAGFAVVSTRQATIDQHRIIATRNAQELVEWLRGESEQDWDGFVAKTNNGTRTYCLNQAITSSLSFTDNSISSISSPSDPPTAAQCAFSGIVGTSPAIYQRTAKVSFLTSDQVSVSVLVQWNEAGKTFSVPLSTILTRLDE